MDRESGSLIYRLTQMLTGHGYFGKYLCRIGADVTAECMECGARCDTAECLAFDEQRMVLNGVIDANLSLFAVIVALLDSEDKKNALITFCEDTMKAKEDRERSRKQTELVRQERRLRRLDPDATLGARLLRNKDP